MVYISTFTCIKSLIDLIHTQKDWLGGSLLRQFPMFRIGLVFMFYIWERELLSGNLQYWPHDGWIEDTWQKIPHWIQNVHFAFPPEPSVFLPQPHSHPFENLWPGSVDLPLVTGKTSSTILASTKCRLQSRCIHKNCRLRIKTVSHQILDNNMSSV